MKWKKLIVICSLAVLGGLLLFTVGEMPLFGSKDSPDKTHVIPRYLEKGEEEAGAKNIITGVILNYRGYDTEGEVSVIFSALCAVIALLGRERRRLSRSGVDAAGRPTSVIVNTVVKFLVPIILFFAVYVMLHGEDSPGGGFQGGAIVGASIIIFTLAFGLPRSTDRIPVGFRIPLESIAVLAFLSMGFLGMLFGVNFLTFILPGLSSRMAHTVRFFMLSFIEVGIGVAGGIIFTSIVFSMIREDEYELPPNLSQP